MFRLQLGTAKGTFLSVFFQFHPKSEKKKTCIHVGREISKASRHRLLSRDVSSYLCLSLFRLLYLAFTVQKLDTSFLIISLWLFTFDTEQSKALAESRLSSPSTSMSNFGQWNASKKELLIYADFKILSQVAQTVHGFWLPSNNNQNDMLATRLSKCEVRWIAFQLFIVWITVWYSRTAITVGILLHVLCLHFCHHAPFDLNVLSSHALGFLDSYP